MDIGTDHRSYSDVDSTVNTNVTLFEFHHMTALGLGILVMLDIGRGGGGYTAFRIHRQNVSRVKKHHQLAITYLGKRQRQLTDASDYDAEEGQGRSYRETEGVAPEGEAPRAVCTHTRPRIDNHHPLRRHLQADLSPRPVHPNAGRRGRRRGFG
jgi:hypothetical protein